MTGNVGAAIKRSGAQGGEQAFPIGTIVKVAPLSESMMQLFHREFRCEPQHAAMQWRYQLNGEALLVDVQVLVASRVGDLGSDLSQAFVARTAPGDGIMPD